MGHLLILVIIGETMKISVAEDCRVPVALVLRFKNQENNQQQNSSLDTSALALWEHQLHWSLLQETFHLLCKEVEVGHGQRLVLPLGSSP